MKLDRALRIDGWMTHAELNFLAETAAKSKLIYEIGSYLGRSTRALGDNALGIVFAIDGWNTVNYMGRGGHEAFRTNEEVFNNFYCNMKDLMDKGKVQVPFKNWEDFHPDKCADFIFVDGEHRYESVRRDIDKALGLIQSGGILAGHDYANPWQGVIKAVDETFATVNIVDSIWWVEMK